MACDLELYELRIQMLYCKECSHDVMSLQTYLELDDLYVLVPQNAVVFQAFPFPERKNNSTTDSTYLDL